MSNSYKKRQRARETHQLAKRRSKLRRTFLAHQVPSFNRWDYELEDYEKEYEEMFASLCGELLKLNIKYLQVLHSDMIRGIASYAVMWMTRKYQPRLYEVVSTAIMERTLLK